MQKPDLPFLPGYTFRDVTKTHHPKARTLDTKNGYAIPKTTVSLPPIAPEDTDKMLAVTTTNHFTTTNQHFTSPVKQATLKQQASPFSPKFVELGDKCLSFDGYWRQSVHESALENYRVRQVRVYYYLIDDTIMVSEPKLPNSGLPQGKLIGRQKIANPDNGNKPFTWRDLNVGANINLFSKVFHLTACDEYTRKYLESNGIEVNPAEELPQDPYLTTRRAVEEISPIVSKKVTPSDVEREKLKTFIDLDRKVLRFGCVWDDRASPFGDLRTCTLNYFLVDDTIEISEVHAANDGRDAVPKLVRRQKIPRDPLARPKDFPSIVLERRQEELTDIIGPEDLAIGQTVNVLGRPFLLTDCDRFTQEFYRKNFGVTDFTPLNVEKPSSARKAAPPPPYTGVGTHEDSMQSVLSLHPKPPKKNERKMLELDNKALRFGVHMETTNHVDAERRFVLTFKLATDTISIMEKKTRMAPGGKFLENTKVKHPDSPSVSPWYYGVQDLYVGARLVIFGRVFVIDEVDQSTSNYLNESLSKQQQQQQQGSEGGEGEQGSEYLTGESFPALHKMFIEEDVDRTGVLGADTIHQLTLECGINLSDEDIFSVIAQCDSQGSGEIDYREFLRILAATY